MKGENLNKNFFIFIGILIVYSISIFSNPAFAANFCVGTAAELHAALSTAAANNDNDVIRIRSSVNPYVGNFVYTSTEPYGLTIEGGNNSDCTARVVDYTNTVLDAENDGPVLVLSTIETSNFIIDGITLINGNHTEYGGGLYLNSQGNIVVSNSSINSNYSGSGGGGVYIRDANSVDIQNSIIASNSGSWGGGILIEYVNGVNVLNNIINSNDSRNDPGGGIRIRYSDTADVNLIGNIITNNSASAHAGGVYIIETDSVRIINNIIAQNNSTYLAGGLHCYRFNRLVLTNNTIVQNTSGDEGGGIRVFLTDDSDVAYIYNNIIFGNTATLGADIYIANDPNVNSITSPVYLYSNDFDQSSSGTYIQVPFTIDPSNLNNVDPEFDIDGYHLTDISPCIDAGVDAGVYDDIDGDSRPHGSGYDIGADEYVQKYLEISIDIKPGSDPNSINCYNDKGIITLAILTTEDFDATTVDHTSVTFEGASETHIDRKSGDPRRHEEDVDGDGDTDLVFHFRQGDTDLTCESVDGTLTGETFDGQTIEGTDAVNMVPAR